MTGLYIARITIEAVSPLSVGSGEAGVSDVMLVRDANGLPMIAGASIQGLMKALAGPKTGLLGSDADRSRIQFSDARIHGSDNAAVSGVALKGVTDPLLKRYLVDEPFTRDHVKIDHRGTNEDAHKFDRAALPRGTRFSFELTMWGDAGDEANFLSILSLVHHPLFRLGGATRRGYGRVKVVARRWRFWDKPLSDSGTIGKLRAKPYSCFQGISEAFPAPADGSPKHYTVTLNSKSWWRAGGGGARAWVGNYEEKHKNPQADKRDPEKDRAAFTREPFVRWSDGGSNQIGWIDPGETLEENYVLAGSSIRGALWHRTLFHWNRLNNRMIDADALDAATASFEEALKIPPALLALFGEVKTDSGGQRAALIIDDVVFQPEAVTVADHVSIDRFTGGARTGALFSEELVQIDQKKGIELNIIVDEVLLKSRLDKLKLPEAETPILRAFKAALDDLCKGRLALGAKSSGYFTDNYPPEMFMEAGQ